MVSSSPQKSRHAFLAILSPLLMVFIAEMVFGGPLGFIIFNVSIRKSLMLVLLMVSIVDLVTRRAIQIWQVYLCSVIGILILIWGIIVPIFLGTNLGDAVSEFMPLLYLLLVFPITLAVRENGIAYYMEFANRCLAIVAIIVIITWVLATFFDRSEFAYLLKYFYAEISGNDFGTYIGPMPDGSFRVMWITCMFFPFMMAYKNFNAIRYHWTVLYLFAAYASGTRSLLYASILLLAIALIRFKPKVMLLAIPILVIAISASLSFFKDSRIFDVSSDFQSDSPRSEQFFSLLRLFSDHPILGAGFGAYADVTRSDAKFSYEMTYVALLAKLGMVGFLFFGGVCVNPVQKALSIHKNRAIDIIIMIGSFVFITSTNPYLLNAFGMTVVSFFLAAVYVQTRFRIGTLPLNYRVRG